MKRLGYTHYIGSAVRRITVQGARYPEQLQQQVGR
jgi:hypothetical protein